MLKKKKWLAFGGVVVATLLIVSIFAAAFPKKKACKHVFDEGTVAIAATCQEEGKLVSKCEKCGEKVMSVIPKTEHDWVNIVALPHCSDGVVEVEFECECGFITYFDADADLKHHDSDHDGYCDSCNYDKFNDQYELEPINTGNNRRFIKSGWYAFPDEIAMGANCLILNSGEFATIEYVSFLCTLNGVQQEELCFYIGDTFYNYSGPIYLTFPMRRIDGMYYCYIPSEIEIFDDDGQSVGYASGFTITSMDYKSVKFDSVYDW